MKSMVESWFSLTSLAFLVLSMHTAALRAQEIRGEDVGVTLKTSLMNEVGYVVAEIPMDYQIKIVGPTNFSLLYLSNNLDCNGIAFTGGFAEAEPFFPNTLLVVDGEMVSGESDRTTGGVVTIAGSDVDLLRMGDWRANGNMQNYMLQSHPILIFDGSIDVPLDDKGRANRIALGQSASGKIFVAMAFDSDPDGHSAESLLSFANNVASLVEHGVTWLINLDGGASAFISTPEKTIAPVNGGISSYFCAEKQK